MNIYDFTVKAQDGSAVSLESYRGKVLIIVNTATECGFTPQYGPLQELYAKHHADGIAVEVIPEEANKIYPYLQENYPNVPIFSPKL